MPGIRGTNSKVTTGNKIKGELKYIAGKVTHNANRMQEGKRLMGKKEWEQDGVV